MFNHQISWIVHQERQRDIERQVIQREAMASRSRDGRCYSIRERIGHRVVQLGDAIAADGPRSRRITRDPCGSLGELAARR